MVTLGSIYSRLPPPFTEKNKEIRLYFTPARMDEADPAHAEATSRDTGKDTYTICYVTTQNRQINLIFLALLLKMGICSCFFLRKQEIRFHYKNMKQKDVSLGNSIYLLQLRMRDHQIALLLNEARGFFKKNPSAKRDTIIF